MSSDDGDDFGLSEIGVDGSARMYEPPSLPKPVNAPSRQLHAIPKPFHQKLVKAMSFIETAPEPPEDLVEGLIPGGNPRIMIAGQPGSLKTFVVQEIMRAVTRGDAAFGRWQAKQGAVCIIEEEHYPGNFARRLKQSGIDLDLLTVGHKTGLKLKKNSMDLHQLCKVLREDPAYNYRVLVLDPFAEFHDRDEENAQEMAEVLDCLNMISNANPNCALLVVHHTTKSSWSRTATLANARGSSRLAGSFDVLYEVTPQVTGDKHTRRAVITCHKNKDADPIPPTLLEINFSTDTYSWVSVDAPPRKSRKKTETYTVPESSSTTSSTLDVEPPPAPDKRLLIAKQIVELLRGGKFASINEVAKAAGIRREAVYSVMKDLKKENYVSMVGGIFTLREDLR